MQIRINPRDWAHIPVWLWPLIWWQLLRLRAHVRKTGQDGFYQIMHDGRVEYRIEASGEDFESLDSNVAECLSLYLRLFQID